MSRSVDALQLGLNYQARFFWAEAAVRLLDEASPVSRVGFDVADIDGFDDVVVELEQPDRDELGRSITRDCYQVKFHVDAQGALTAGGLCEPKEISGTSRSLLQRVQSSGAKLGDEVERTRLKFVSTHPIDKDDLLAELCSTNEGGIRTHKLKQGGNRSKMGKLRAMWREHLELESDEELFHVLRPLRFCRSAPDYARLKIELEPKLSSVGLLVEAGDGAQDRYEQLIWRLHREGSHYFDAVTLRAECERASLTTDPPEEEYARPKIAVRSFKRPFVELADTSEELLSLLHYFDGRFLHEENSWETVQAELEPFFRDVVSSIQAFDLQLDTHASLAFAAGVLLEPKLGLDLNILQFSRGGMKPWPAAARSADIAAALAPENFEIRAGQDVAVALSITHDIIDDVEQHIASADLPVGRVLAIRPEGGSNPSAVQGAEHALAIADEVAALIKKRTPGERDGHLHLFAAAPNALVFFLGQLSKGFGRVTLYEFDFEKTRSGGYEPSFSLPIPQGP